MLWSEFLWVCVLILGDLSLFDLGLNYIDLLFGYECVLVWNGDWV